METGLQTYFLVVGIILLLLAGFLFYRRLSATLNGISVIGQVVGHEVRTMDDSTSYLPIVEFKDTKGTLHRFTSVAGGTQQQPKIGTELTVRYFRSDPKVVYIQSFLHMWAAPVAFVLLGLVAFAVVYLER